jgi:hypothetical protein
VDELLAKAEKAATLANSDHAAGILLLMRGVASCLRGEWRAAVDLCGEAERIFRERCTNVAWELNTAQQFPLAALYWMGEFAEMARRVPRFVSEAQQRGNRYALTNSAVFVYPSLAADDPRDAEGQLRECAIQWSHAGVHVQHFYLVQGWAHCELYRGRGINALRQLEQEYPRLRRAGLLRVQNLRATTHDAIGRSALAVAQERGPTRALLRLAAARARSLMRERMPWAEALATMIRAGIAGVNGDDDSAVPLLKRASDGFEAAEMGLHAAVARRRLGEILGGEEGQRLVEDADRWLTAQGIQVPERFAAMYAPGFDRSDG